MYKRVGSKEQMMRNFYMIQQLIGQGAFGSVFQAVNKVTGQQFAIKTIDKSRLGGDQIQNLQLQIDILSSIDHPNIVRTEQIYDQPHQLHIVMQLMTGGQLFQRIVQKQYYSQKQASDTIKPVIQAIKYCHDVGIAHRDLKPQNILYSQEGPGGIIKISDFGLARFYDDDLMTTACGTPGYVAPDILTGKGYGLEVDQWSIGVILYIMLCGFPPFSEDTNQQLFEIIKIGKYEFVSPYWDNISQMAKDLISRCLIVDKNQRITADEMLQHPWIIGDDTPREELPEVTEEIKRYNRNRKFKKAGTAVLATTKFMAIGKRGRSRRER